MGSQISKIATYLPNKVISNEQLSEEFGRWEPETMENKIGIRERHIAGNDETAGDLAYQAAKILLNDYDPDKVDMLILCTQSPDYFLPTTACLLQSRLKLKTSLGAFDFNLGCSGYIYGLAVAKSLINTSIANSVLLIMAETYSKHIHEMDLANKSIFGDGAAATIIEKSSKEHILNFELGTDGTGKNNLIVQNGCFRNPKDSTPDAKQTTSGDVYTDNHLYMNGPQIFNFTVDAVPKAVSACLEKNNLGLEDVDYFIFHQANKFMIDYLRKKIKIPVEKFYNNLLHTGNTVSATIPIALQDSINKKLVKPGDKVLLCGFGVGYSWGAVIIEV